MSIMPAIAIVLSIVATLIAAVLVDWLQNVYGSPKPAKPTRKKAVVVVCGLVPLIALIAWPSFLDRASSSVELPKAAKGKELQKITFDYKDHPTNHGWVMVDTPNPKKVIFTYQFDAAVGNVMEINPSVRYALDHEIPPIAQTGDIVRVLSVLEKDKPFYIRVEMKDANGETTEGWLNCYLGQGDSVQESPDEWIVYVQPKPHNGSWSMTEVDVREVANETFGRDGRTFNRLIRLRFRGKAALGPISISKR